MNWKHILKLILFSIGIKIVYLLLSYALEERKEEPAEQYIGVVKKYDAYWYHTISTNGYPDIENKRDLGYSEGENFKQSEWAFFPFYPALNHTTAKFLGISIDASAFIWSLFFSALSILGLYWFGLIFYKDESLAFFNTLLLFCFPFSFYFSMFYTEALFFTFMIFSFICIHYRRYLFLAILLIPLILLRPNGLIVLLPLYLYFLEQNGILEKFKIHWKKLFERENLIQSLAFVSGPIAFIAYGFFQLKKTGYFMAFSIAQDGWYRELTFPILSFFRRGDIATQFNSVFAILVIVYAFWIRKKLPISLNVLVLLSLLLPLCSGSVMSMTRFVSIIFPLFLILSGSTYKLKYKYVILVLIVSLHFLSYYFWLINHQISQ